VRMGGYPRLWFGDGGHLDLPQLIGDENVAAYEAEWRAHHVRVEWLVSPHGRLDRVLPQTLERIVHNANVRSGLERKSGPY
jgi:hypothetical protein